MMPKLYVYAYIGVLLLANILWAALPTHNKQFEQMASQQDWVLRAEGKSPVTDLQSLMQAGFWGKWSNSQSHSDDVVTSVEVAAAEARKLRVQVRAIINNGNSKEVIFGVAKDYHRVKLGDLLPGTQWILVGVGEDWLKLSRSNDESKTELLRLFAGQEAENDPANDN